MDAGLTTPIPLTSKWIGKMAVRTILTTFTVAVALASFPAQSFGNSHGSKTPAWYLTLSSPHLTRAQELALSAPVTGTASSTAPSAGSPDPASTTAFLANLQNRYDANPKAFAAISPQYAALFKTEEAILAGNYSSVSGLVPTTAAWNYLRYRRSLDPARFDACHPQIGPLLDLDQQIRHQLDNQPQTQPQILNPPTPPAAPSDSTGSGGTPPVSPTTPPVLPNGPMVPEPSSIILLGFGLVGIAWFIVATERKRFSRIQDRADGRFPLVPVTSLDSLDLVQEGTALVRQGRAVPSLAQPLACS